MIVSFMFAIVSIQSVQAVSSSCSYDFRQTCCGGGGTPSNPGSKILATGTVTINHNISMQGGTKTNFQVGDVIRFNYSWDGSFTATGGAWDTPTVLKCSGANACFNEFVGNTRANNYTQRITDATGKTGYVQWQADRSSNYGIIVNSSNPAVVTCAGTTCSVVGNGSATLTVRAPRVWVRIFAKIFSDVAPDGWYASLAPEGFIYVPGKGYVTGNSTVSDGNPNTDDCVIRNMKDVYIDPPPSSTGNYKGLRIPSRNQTFAVNATVPKTNPTAVIDVPATATATYPQGQSNLMQGHGVLGDGGGSIGWYTWNDVNPGTPSYNGTRCSSADGVQVAAGPTATSFDVQSLSIGTHRICFNVRQDFPDGTSLWAGSAGNVEYRDITIVQPAPTVDLKGSYGGVNNSDGPLYVVPNDPFALNWTVSNATSCTASSSDGGWSGSKSATGGYDSNITTSVGGNYTLNCSGAGGSSSDTVQVNLCSAQSYSCIGSPSVDCNVLPDNCGKENTVSNSCNVTYNCNGNTVVRSEAASVCRDNGVDCSDTVTQYCPACEAKSTWIEVKP